MKYRTGLIQAAKDMGPAGTETIDIKFKQTISRIEMTFKTTKSKHGMDAPGPANIPKIELIDGSKPLHSLSGYSNQALAYYSRPDRILTHGQEMSGSSAVEVYAIDFGRYLHDPLLAFDPMRFSNPQLRITWDEDVSDTGVTANSMEIWAELFDELVPAPMGFLSARQLWTGNFLAENSWNKVMLPEDEVIRQLLVRAHFDGYEPWYQIDQAKLDENNDDRVIFSYDDLETFYRRMKSHWPMIKTELIGISISTGRTFYVPQTDYWAQLIMQAHSQNGGLYTTTPGARGGKATVTDASNSQFAALAMGYLPWSTFQFPMGKQQDPDDWFDPAGKKPRLQLLSNTAGVSGDGEVIIETIHKY